MYVLLNIVTVLAIASFIIVIGMRVFNLAVMKCLDGSWVVYNTEIYNASDIALKDLKSEIDGLTRQVDNSEERINLLKKENVGLRALSDAREEQVLALASLLEESGIAVKEGIVLDESNSEEPVYIVIRSDGLAEEKEQVIKDSADALNKALVQEVSID